QVCSLAYVWLTLRVVAAEKEYSGSGRNPCEDSRVTLRREFQSLGQHKFILVRIRVKSIKAPRLRSFLSSSQQIRLIRGQDFIGSWHYGISAGSRFLPS